MAKKVFFLRYALELKRLQQSPATFVELSEYLTYQAEFTDEIIGFSKRTFQRDMQDIRAIFNTDILYNRKTKAYYIENTDNSASANRMLEAFELFNALNLSEDFSHIIYFEKRKPQGTHHFYPLVHAIKKHLCITVSYRKFGSDIIINREVQPYALKEFKNRWYLIAKEENENFVKTYGLDRILELKITKKKFAPPQNFNGQELYKNYFGIISTSNKPPEKIVLSFDKYNGEYIKSFPLHESQTILIDNKKEVRIKLFIHITQDFEMELLSYGDKVYIISPASLKKRLREIYKKALAKN